MYGRNRNINTTLGLMRFLQSGETDIKVIDQKFLMPGHSFPPNDSDFGSVELAAKGKTVYLPVHWYSRTKKFIVCPLNLEEFYSTSNLERNISRRR
ncbi:hypothetical protein AVEN_86521-1 [Araneus ventricosus]|uniref:Uncharacterized protein n=1 Tax=Araneus ventricosus TaxID=182803 RepID=A0A4Y2PUG9_ARAVE|nr:hypothetical protein AVEN_86521-1 [Araneus ventricosus]